MEKYNNDVKIPLVKQGCPSAIITYNKEASFLECMAAKELQGYIEKLTGVQLKMSEPFDTGCRRSETVIRIGLKTSKKDCASMQKPGSFTINCERDKDVWIISIDGFDPAGTLYGTYAFIEKLGITFLLSGELLPPKTSGLSVDPVNEIQQPAFSKRGFIHGSVNMEHKNYDLIDYFKLIDQMVKLRFNFFILMHSHGEPWIEYTYRGEKNLLGDITSKESGYMYIKSGRPHHNITKLKVGSELFNNRQYMAPFAFQDLPDQQEAINRYSHMIHEILGYAKQRGITVALAFDANTMVPNFARFARKHGSRPHDGVYGSNVSPTDPLGMEIGEYLLNAVVETYPEIDQLFIFCSEDFRKCKHSDSMALYEKMKPHFKVATDILDKQWQSLCKKFAVSTKDAIDIDIGMIELARKLLDKARIRYPRMKIGIGFFFRGYLLSCMDKLIERDVAFMDWQSSGVFPLAGDVNAEYFNEMGNRERMIIPRVDDDGSMFGMPFYLRQYQTDGLFEHAYKAGVTGFAGQLIRIRGTEHHTRFLSQGSWNPELTPETFYNNYAEDLFGTKAAPYMTEAFRILEDNEQELGWRGSYNFTWAGGCNELKSVSDTLLAQNNPYNGPKEPSIMAANAEAREKIFKNAVDHLLKALDSMKKAYPLVSKKGEPMLDYLHSKTSAYILHLEMIILFNKSLLSYVQAFANNIDNEEGLACALDNTVLILEQTCKKAYETTRKVAEYIDHPNDLAILFLSNIWNIDKVEAVLSFIKRVANYHNGRPYWKECEEELERWSWKATRID